MSGGGTRIRLQTDEDFNQAIVEGLRLRRPEIDILTALAAGLRGQGDPAVLASAADNGRVLVSHDFATMPTHFDTFIVSGRESPGLLLIRQELPIGRAIEALLFVWELSGPDDWRNLRVVLPL